MEAYYGLLEYMGLDINNFYRIIQKWNNEQKAEFVQGVSEQIEKIDVKDSTLGHYGFIANSQLSGGISPCANFKCRLGHVDGLARFATLYADMVLIENPFDKYDLDMNFNDKVTQDLINDVGILFHLRALFDSKILRIARSNLHFCPECYHKVIPQYKDFEEKVHNVFNLINGIYLDEVSFTYIIDDYCYPYFEIKGPESLIEHGKRYIRYSPEYLEKRCKRFFDINQAHVLSEQEVLGLGLIEHLTNPVFDDIIRQNYYSNRYNINYLTDRDIDFKVLDAVNRKEVKLRSKSMIEGLSHCVPYINQASLSDLVDLREKEGEAFLVYRDAINSVIKSIDSTEARDYVEAYRDKIEPELHKINLTVKNSKILAKQKIARNLIECIGRVSIGWFSGLVPQSIGHIIAGLGGLSGVNILKDVLELEQEPVSIRDNKYYFLWKVDKLDN